jgi:hypothetical protein
MRRAAPVTRKQFPPSTSSMEPSFLCPPKVKVMTIVSLRCGLNRLTRAIEKRGVSAITITIVKTGKNKISREIILTVLVMRRRWMEVPANQHGRPNRLLLLPLQPMQVLRTILTTTTMVNSMISFLPCETYAAGAGTHSPSPHIHQVIEQQCSFECIT